MRWRLRDARTPELVRWARRSARYARRQARADRRAAAESAAWLDQNRTTVDAKNLQGLWDSNRDALSAPLLELAVRYLARGEALQRANEGLQKGLRMPAAGLANRPFDTALLQVLGLEQLALILEHSHLPAAVRDAVLQQAVLRAFPTAGEGSQSLRTMSTILRQVDQIGKNKELPFGYAGAQSRIQNRAREGAGGPGGAPRNPFTQKHIETGWEPRKPAARSRDNGEF